MRKTCRIAKAHGRNHPILRTSEQLSPQLNARCAFAQVLGMGSVKSIGVAWAYRYPRPRRRPPLVAASCLVTGLMSRRSVLTRLSSKIRGHRPAHPCRTIPRRGFHARARQHVRDPFAAVMRD